MVRRDAHRSGREVGVDTREVKATLPRALADPDRLHPRVRRHLHSSGDPTGAGSDYRVGDGVRQEPPLDGRPPARSRGRTHPRKGLKIDTREDLGHDAQSLFARGHRE